MRLTDHFQVEELVSPYYIDTYGAKKMKKIIRRYNPLMLLGLENLKAFLNGEAITINNYLFGGSYTNSGLRHWSTTVGAELSAHKFLQATDNKYKNTDPKEVEQQIMDNQEMHPYIVRMEDSRSTRSSRGRLGRHWHHIQWGYRLPHENIILFKP